MPVTPGELPMAFRSRSAGMEGGREAEDRDQDADADDEDIGGTTIGGETAADESLTAGGDRATGGRDGQSSSFDVAMLQARGDRLAVQADQEQQQQGPLASPSRGVALTAAALSPSVGHHRHHHHHQGAHRRRRSTQTGSATGGGGEGGSPSLAADHGSNDARPSSSSRDIPFSGGDSTSAPSSTKPRYRFHQHGRGGPPSPFGPAHSRDWSGGRGSIGPRSPWANDEDDDEMDEYGQDGESDTSSSAGSASEVARSR